MEVMSLLDFCLTALQVANMIALSFGRIVHARQDKLGQNSEIMGTENACCQIR